MTHYLDELSKCLAERSVPRRESVRLIGAALAGAMLGPLGMGTAWARREADPCKSFCRCSKKAQQNACLAACRACSGAASRLCGTCARGYYCAHLTSDMYNCGACGRICPEPGPFEYGACIDGRCEYTCVDGAVDCGEGCTNLEWDSSNCGACGFICNAATPYCHGGACHECPAGSWNCQGVCTDLAFDPRNCGACGFVCNDETPYCHAGVCGSPPYYPDLGWYY